MFLKLKVFLKSKMNGLSVIIPAYNEEKNIVPLYRELTNVLKKLGKDHEIILIDDGSRDNTFRIIESLNKKDKKIKVIKFRKNFGQTASLDAGFKKAKGNTIVVMDADLQNDPKDIPRLLEKLSKGYDVVSGWRYNRKDGIFKRIVSKFANLFRVLLTKEKIHDAGCSLKAYKKECLKDLDLYGEMHRYITTTLSWKGFKIGEVKVNHRKRRYGKTKYGITRLIKGFLDLIVLKFWMQYSARPIHIFGGIGILSFVIGFVIGLYLTFIRLLFGSPLSNRPLLLLAILLVILGVQLLVLGILGDILIKTYYGRERKYYSIEKEL